MRDEWIDHALKLAATPADFYSGCRKIIRGPTLEFKKVTPDLVMADCGYTMAKLRMLQRNYHQKESREAALVLWKERVERGKYGSVGFSTYNHLIKGNGLSHFENVNAKKRKDSGKPPGVNRASVMGPCIQSVTLTLLPQNRVAIDVFYRTTEFFKKFPADLVFLREDLLQGFDHLGSNVVSLRGHFANITLHPMYFIIIMGLVEDPLDELDRIKKKDKRFYDWVIKWTGRYLLPEQHRGIAKFSQALQVQRHAHSLFDKAELKKVQKYLRDNHPGHRNDYEEDGDEE